MSKSSALMSHNTASPERGHNLRLPAAPHSPALLWLRYGVALLSAATAIFLRELLTPLWGNQLPFLTLFPAVLVSTWYGGLGPGLVTTALCAIAAAYFWLTPFHSLTVGQPAELLGLVLAVLVMLLITWLTVARQRAEQHLRERVEELETLWDLLPISVWHAHDPAGTHITGNQAGYEMIRMPVGTNTSLSAPPHERPTTYMMYHPDGTAIPPEALPMQYAATHGVAVPSTEFLYRFTDGTELYAYGTAKPLFDAQGQVRGSLGVFMDITAHKQAEKTLTQHARDLARTHADLRQIAYVSAHDLQEPVRQLGLYTQYIASRYRDALESDIQEAIIFIVEGSKRMQAQFADLMQYLEIEEPGESVTTTDCETVLQDALDALQESIAAIGATVTHDPLPTLTASAKHLQLVFQELIDNALKFRNSTSPQVHVWAEREDGGWRFAVRDSGIGIAPSAMGQLFRFFRKFQRHTDYPGTGMGLAICKKIVERHGGRIWVESRPKEGTTVLFTIADRSSQNPVVNRKEEGMEKG